MSRLIFWIGKIFGWFLGRIPQKSAIHPQNPRNRAEKTEEEDSLIKENLIKESLIKKTLENDSLKIESSSFFQFFKSLSIFSELSESLGQSKKYFRAHRKSAGPSAGGMKPWHPHPRRPHPLYPRLANLPPHRHPLSPAVRHSQPARIPPLRARTLMIFCKLIYYSSI
jgi:hypothetical protein